MGAILTSIWNGIKEFFHLFSPIGDFIVKTGVPDQIQNVKYKELFTNGWFLVPYLAVIGWNIFKKDLKTVIILLLLTGTWAFFGTPYMHRIMHQGQGGQVTLDAVLPLVGGAVVILGIIIYLVFIRSE